MATFNPPQRVPFSSAEFFAQLKKEPGGLYAILYFKEGGTVDTVKADLKAMGSPLPSATLEVSKGITHGIRVGMANVCAKASGGSVSRGKKK